MVRWAFEWRNGETLYFSKTMILCDMKEGASWPLCVLKAKVIQGSWPEITRIECLLAFSNNFSSETTGPVLIKFHVQPPGSRWLKIGLNGTGFMTKMAALPIYGKNLRKSSSPEPLVWLPWNLVCSIRWQSPQSLFKWWLKVDLDQFFIKVKYSPLEFRMEKRWNIVFFTKQWYSVIWKKVLYAPLWISKAKVIKTLHHELGPVCHTYLYIKLKKSSC